MRGKGVKKTYLYHNIETRIEKLINVYRIMEMKNVPNVDHFEHYNKVNGSVYLTPKGIPN